MRQSIREASRAATAMERAANYAFNQRRRRAKITRSRRKLIHEP